MHSLHQKYAVVADSSRQLVEAGSILSKCCISSFPGSWVVLGIVLQSFDVVDALAIYYATVAKLSQWLTFVSPSTVPWVLTWGYLRAFLLGGREEGFL